MKLKEKFKKFTKSDILVIITTIIITTIMMMSGGYKNDGIIHGKITEEINSDSKMQMKRNMVKVKILNGDHKDKVVTVDNLVNDKMHHQTSTHKGDEVLLNIEENNDGSIKRAFIYELVRYKYIQKLVLVFILLLSIVGGMRGVRAVLALIITTYAVIKILIPLIFKGFDPIAVSIFICIGVSILNLLIISGKNKKTLASIIGTVGGVIVAGVIALMSSSVLQIIGLNDEEAQTLIYITNNSKFDFKGLLFAGILMGALGAVMDISMSIASSMNEIKVNNPKITNSELIKSGINVGRDIMGTMANTLILAYAGGSMYVLLFMHSYNYPFIRMLDQDVMSTEILKSLCGSIGLIFAIPITTVAVILIGTDKIGIDKLKTKRND